MTHRSAKGAFETHHSPKVILPTVVVTRRQIYAGDEWHFSRSVHANEVIISKNLTTNEASIVTMSPVQIDYSVTLYDNKFSNLDRMMLNWFMRAGQHLTYFSYTHDDLGDEEIDVVMAFEQPESVKPSRIEVESQQGDIYSQTFPFNMRTLLFLPQSTAKIITTVQE